MRRRSALAAVPLLVLLSITGTAEAEAGPVTSGDPARTATLITGDRVTVSPDGGISIRPGKGRDGIPMFSSTEGGHVRVVPADAVPLVRSGQVDGRLFDVTGLLAAGYDDRRRELPLIVGETTAPAGTVVRRLPSIKARAVRTPKRDAATFWATISKSTGTGAERRTGKVWLDAVGRFTGAEGVQQIGAPAAWSAGLTGAGVTVGVIDSGVDAAHPDLAGVLAAQVDFTRDPPSSGDVRDTGGHGTHVASILAGSGAASGGRYRGVAPGVRLVSAKVGDTEMFESDVIAAMEWAAGQQHAKVVNISLGVPDSPGIDPLEAAVDDLTRRHGTLFVVAVGNDGNNGNDPGNGNDYDIRSPGSATAALSVGAVDHDDLLADFSSRGPRAGDDAIKPDIMGPGVDVTGARSSDTGGDGAYLTGFGTSFAAPHVAGSAAILAQRHPDWTPAMLKSALVGTARPIPGAGVYAAGGGRVDIPSALAGTVLAEPATVSFAAQSWPHTDDQRTTRAVTYRNTTDRAVTLALNLTVTGPGGAPAPAGMFELSARTVTVPANGTAPVTVAVNPVASAADGPYSGSVTASAQGARVGTPIGLIRETEHHELTIEHIGRDGQPTEDIVTRVIGIDTPFRYDSVYHYDGEPQTSISVRVPRGRYAIVSALSGEDETGYHTTTLVQPDLRVDAARTLTLDARAGRPVEVTVPRPAVRDSASVVTGIRTLAGWTSLETYSGSGGPTYTARLGTAGDPAGFVSGIRVALRDPADAPAYVYQTAAYRRGDLSTGFSARLRAEDFAVVRQQHRMHSPANLAWVSMRNVVPGRPLVMTGTQTPVAATQYVQAVPDVAWVPEAAELTESGGLITTVGDPASYRAGRTYRLDWNAPVHGPCLTADSVTWRPDALTVRVPMLCDGAGHLGSTDFDTGATTLTRDGVVVGDAERVGRATFHLRPDGRRYRLRLTADRADGVELSRRSTVDWSFTAPRNGSSRPLPLSVVRVHPQTGEPAAGATVGIPMTVQRQPGAPAAKSVIAAASFDDGATWQSVPVRRTGTDTFTAEVAHPARAGFVSLRVTAAAAGSSVEQTFIRAYRTTPG